MLQQHRDGRSDVKPVTSTDLSIRLGTRRFAMTILQVTGVTEHRCSMNVYTEQSLSVTSSLQFTYQGSRPALHKPLEETLSILISHSIGGCSAEVSGNDMTHSSIKWTLCATKSLPYCPCVAKRRRPERHSPSCSAREQSTTSRAAVKGKHRDRKARGKGISAAQLPADEGGVEHSLPHDYDEEVGRAAGEEDAVSRRSDDVAANVTVQIMPGGLQGSQALVARPRREARQHSTGVLPVVNTAVYHSPPLCFLVADSNNRLPQCP